jgi:hypothetical protein
MSGCKPTQQTGDSAARKAKLAELEREQEQLLDHIYMDSGKIVRSYLVRAFH